MNAFKVAVLTAAIVLGTASAASAQYVYPAVPVIQPVAPVVSYSYYPSTPVVAAPPAVSYYSPSVSYYPPTTSYYTPTTSYYAPAVVPSVSYYPAPVVTPTYGVYSTTTTYGGLGIFRPRQTTTYYYAPVVR